MPAGNELGRASLWARAVRHVADLQYRMFDWLRHLAAFSAAQRPPSAPDFAALRGHHVCLLVTYKRSGEPVPSPVTYALAGGTVYLRCETRSAKLRRLARNPDVLIGPCTYRGKPLAPLSAATARCLNPTDAVQARDALFASYRFFDRIYESVADRMPVDLSYVEVVPR